MSQGPSFIPGRRAEPGRPLANYRPHQPVTAVRDYVRELTPQDGLIVDLFCQGPRFVHEALQAGRRVVGFSINPVLLHAVRLGLTGLDPRILDGTLTRLADTFKGELPLHKHLTSLYRTRCPTCRGPGTADWLAWNRDADRPFEKGVRCRSCAGLQIGPTDQEDVTLAHSFAERRLAYYYALDRAAPPDHPARGRATDLVACYTPRNLSALMDLTRHLDDAKPKQDAGIVLKAALLDCFDRCSKLYPYDAERRRVRTLRIPVRYLERNVWFCFEEALAELAEHERPSSVPNTADLDTLLRGGTTGYTLIPRAARDAPRLLGPDSADLVFVDPPRPDGVFWALSALWSTWLWDTRDARAMRPFLRRRRFDWHWHWRALRRALVEVGPCLTDHGFLITLFSGADREMHPSVCLAAAGAGYRLQTWGYAPEVGYRLVWRWHPDEAPVPLDLESLESELASEVRVAAVDTLRRRNEPTPTPLLRAAIHAHLVDRRLLAALATLEPQTTPVERLANSLVQGLAAASIAEPDGEAASDKLWLSSSPEEETDTLADEVELTVRRLMANRLVWQESDLINAVYAHFPGSLTPDLTLVRVCIASYAIGEGQEVHLRSEDDLERRQSEIAAVRQDLIDLGRQLGFESTEGREWDVCWRDDDRERYLFVVAATAALGAHLLGGRDTEVEARPCLVVPGGRAELIDFKLRRDPRLARAMSIGGWEFVKFRHLRRLMAEEDLDSYTFQTVLGLDPVVEQERTQLTLF